MSSSGKKKPVSSGPRWHVSSAFGTKKAATTPTAASSTPAASPSSDKTMPRLPDSSPSRSPISRSPRGSLSAAAGGVVAGSPSLVQPLWVAPTHKQVIVPLKSPWQKAQEASLALDHAINAHSLSQAEQQYQQLLSLLTASVAASNSSVPQPQHQLNTSHTNFVIDALSRHLFLFSAKVQEVSLDQLRSLLSPSALILPEAEALAIRINCAKNLTQIVQVHMQPAAAVKSIVDSLVNLLWIDFDATEYEQHQLLWSACFDRSLVPVFVQLFRLTYESAAKLTQSANDVDARAHVALLDHLLACLSEQSSAIDSHQANYQICEQLKALLIEDDMVPLTHKHFLSFFANLIRLHDFDSANDLPLLGGSEVSEEEAEMKRERQAQFIEDMNLILARRSGIEREFQPQLNENVQLFISCIALADAYESHGVEVKPFADYYERSISPRLNEVDPLYRKELVKAARTVSSAQEDRSATPSRSHSRPPSTTTMPTEGGGQHDAPMGPKAVMQLMETLQAAKGTAAVTSNENAIGSQPLPPLPISASELTSAPRRPPSPTRASTPTLGGDSAHPLPFVPAVAASNNNGKQNGFIPINPARDSLAPSPLPARSPSHSPLPSRSPSASPNALTQNDKLLSDLKKENESLKNSLQTAQSSYTALLKSSEAESNEVASLRVAKTQLQKQLSEERARFAALEPLTPGNRDRESIGTAHRELAEAELELRLKDAHLIRLEGELREAQAKAGNNGNSSDSAAANTDQSAAVIQDLKQQLEELEEEVIELRSASEEQTKKASEEQATALAAQSKKLTESHQKEMEQVLQQWKRDVMTKDEALAAATSGGSTANVESESKLKLTQEKLQQLEALEQELQIDLLAVRNENALLQEQAKHSEAQISDLNQRIQSHSNEQQTAGSASSAEVDTLKARIAELERTIQEGESQVEELQNEITTLSQQAKDSEADLESIEAENADLKQSLADAQDALSEAQTAIQQANTALEESESELQRAKEELADADAQHEAHVEQVKAEAAEVHTNLSQETEAKYNEQIATLQEEIDTLKSSSTKSSSENEVVHDLQHALHVTKQSLADSESKLKAQADEMNIRVQEVEFESQKELRASAQQLTQTQRALAHAEQQAKDLRDELALMKETNASVANAPDLPLPTSANYAQIVSLKQQVAQLTESLSKSSGVNIEPIVKDANESRVKVAKLEEDVQSLSLQLEEAHALLAEAQTVISTLKKDAKVADDAAATALSELQERLEKQEDINVELHDRLEAAEAQHATRAAPTAEEAAQSAGPDKDEEAHLDAYERSQAVPAVQSISAPAPSGSLQQQLKEAKDYIKELEDATTIAVTELENEKLQLQDQLAERDARIQQLSAKSASSSLIPASTDVRLAQMDAELKAVKAEASASNLAASTRVGELKLESKSLQEQLSTAKLRIADLEGVADVELENFKNILHKQQRDLDATLQSRAAEYEARIKELEEAERASQEKLNEMQEKLDTAHVSLDSSRVENNLLTRRGIDYESLSNQLSSFEIQVASLRDDLATKEEDLAQAMTDLKQHQAHLEEAQQGEQNATTALLTLQSEHTALRSEHADLVPLKSELERLNKTYEEFRASQADSLRSLLAHAEAKSAHELKAIKEENDTKLLLSATQAEMQLSACEAQLRTEKAQSEQWRTQYQVLAETHQQLVVNAEQHQQTMLQMRSAYVHVLSELRGQLRSLRESSNRCRSDVVSMRATVQADVARAAPSTTHYITAGLQALHDRYRANIDNLESKRQTESSRLIVQANNANMELLVQKKMVSQLQEDLTATQAKAAQSDSEIARLKEELINSASAALTSASGGKTPTSSRNTGDLTVLLSRSEAQVKHLTAELQQRHEEILELHAQLQHSGLANFGEESVNNSLQSIQEEDKPTEAKAKTLNASEEAVAKSAAGPDDTSASISFEDEDSSSTRVPVDVEPTQPELTVNVNSSASTTTGSPIGSAAVAPASVSTVSPPSSVVNQSVASSETERTLRQRLIEVEQNLNATLFNHQIAIADASKNLEQVRHESADTIAAMETKLQERERELAAQNAAVALRQTQIDSLQSQLASMEALQSSLKNQLSAEQRTAELNLANSQTANEEKLKMLMLEHEQHLACLADEATGDRAASEAALKASMERYAALQENLDNERQEAGSTRAQLLHRINDLQDALTHTEAECVQLRAHVAAAAEAVASESSLSHERLAEAQHHAAELTESRAIFNLLQKQYEALMEEHERVTTAEKIRVAIQKKDADALEKERLAERMELETFKRSHRDLEVEKKDLIVRNQSLYDELVSAKARLVEAENHTTTISQLNDSLESSKVEAARLSAELEHTLIQRAQLQQERSHGQMSHSQLEQNHTSLRDQFAQVSRQLQSTKAEVESLSKQLNLSQSQRDEERAAVDAQRRAQDQLVLHLQSEVSSLNRIVLAETNLRAVAQREVAEARIKLAETASETRRKVDEKEKEAKRKTELYEKELERVKSQAMMDKEKMLAESEAKSKTAAAAATVAAMAAATKYEKSFANASATASALKINTNTSPTHTRNLSTRSVSISTPQHHPAPSPEESQVGKGAVNDSMAATPAPSPASVANGWSPAPNFAASQAQAAHGSNSLYGSPLSTVASPSSNSSFLSSPGPASRFSNFLPQRLSPSSAAFPSAASNDGSLLTEWVPPKVPQYEKGSSALSIAASYKHMTSLLAPSAGFGTNSATRPVPGSSSSASILARPFPGITSSSSTSLNQPAVSPTFSASSAASRNSQLSLDFTPVSTLAQPSAIAASATPTAIAASTPSGNSTARIVYAPSGVTVTNAIQRPLAFAPPLNASSVTAAPSEPSRSTLPPSTHDRKVSGTLESAVISELDAHYQYTS